MHEEIRSLLDRNRPHGWVLEPDAKRILSLTGIPVPDFAWAETIDGALAFARDKGFPLVAKVVSPVVVHKSEVKGVMVGIKDEEGIRAAFDRFSRLDGFAGMLVEETAGGLEVIIGAKNDYQFGPVVLFGLGGTGVEIYQDVVVRMAPLEEDAVEEMVARLTARRLFSGYRGSAPVDLKALGRVLAAFSRLAMELEEEMESIDLNPVFCSEKRCLVADARIMLKKK